MKVKVWIEYEAPYLPPRCRKLRYQATREHVTMTLLETSMENLRLAFEDTSYEEVKKIYSYKGKLWRLAVVRDIACGDEAETRTPLENLIYVLEHSSRNFYRSYMRDDGGTSREAMVKRARTDLRRYLLVGKDLYIQTSEPRYCIYTFGLGHNHGGSSLSVSYGYNPNISRDRYFSVLQSEEAVAEATRIALSRGDTDSVKYIKATINVFAPDLVKVRPKRQHGKGNPFLNAMETITESAPDAMTAGILCMAAAAENM